MWAPPRSGTATATSPLQPTRGGTRARSGLVSCRTTLQARVTSATLQARVSIPNTLGPSPPLLPLVSLDPEEKGRHCSMKAQTVGGYRRPECRGLALVTLSALYDDQSSCGQHTLHPSRERFALTLTHSRPRWILSNKFQVIEKFSLTQTVQPRRSVCSYSHTLQQQWEVCSSEEE